MYGKSSLVSDRPGGYAQTDCVKNREQLILPLKTLMRKGHQDASSLNGALRNLI
jgi:hypothetical protein